VTHRHPLLNALGLRVASWEAEAEGRLDDAARLRRTGDAFALLGEIDDERAAALGRARARLASFEKGQ
jgi:hypothetical protein